MAGNGGMGGVVDGPPNVGHPQGTEYTLQGVMRFLQTEWHRHERDRNAWEIERAEMKSRIGRLEGDARTSKRMHESLGKHVKMLESALKKERGKTRSLSAGEAVDLRDPKELAKENLRALSKQQPKPQGAPVDLDLNAENGTHPDMRQDSERDKSRMYLGKCSQEVAYHITPGSHPPPDLMEQQDLSDHGYQNHQMQRQPLDEAYQQQYQHQQKQKFQQQAQQQHNHVNMVREPSIHQPLPSNFAENPNLYRPQMNHAPQEPIEARPFEQQSTHSAQVDRRKPAFDLPHPADEVESITHAFDSYGKEVPVTDSPHPVVNKEATSDDSDGWNFDESPINDTAPSVTAQHHRPDTDAFPSANFMPPKSPPKGGPGSHRRKSSGGQRRSEGSHDSRDLSATSGQKSDPPNFKVRFALRGHLDVVRSVIFTGGGSPSEPEICTGGDDGTIKRWIIPASYGSFGPHSNSSGNDLDITSYFTHRGHAGPVTCLAACPPSPNFSNGGRALGDGWIFSGGQDGSIKVWERGRVDPKDSLERHTDSVWALCVLPGTAGSIFGEECNHYGGPDRIILVSGASDGRILIWAISAPPQSASPQSSSRRGGGGSRRANSISSGSNFPSSPQPSTKTATRFQATLIHTIVLPDSASPTCVSPLSLAGVNFVVSCANASIIIYDTRSGEEIVGMASLETYDGTPSTGVNSVVASTIGFDGTANLDPNRALAEEEAVVHGATGSSGGVEGVIISGYEDRYIRFFDANSGQCTYTMLAHPAAISSISLSPDGRELVSAGHDASLRFWSLEKRKCEQELTSHRLMRGEGVCSVVWSQDGRWVVSGGGDGVVKVFAR